MNLNMLIDQNAQVEIRGVKYPIAIAGKGLPCLAICIGTLMQCTLSNRFKQHFKVYSTDLYWDSRYKLEDPSSLDMPQIIADIAELGQKLVLSSYVLLAHSALRIVALEFEKKYPTLLKGIIMIGTPVKSDEKVAQIKNAFFEVRADVERKKIDQECRKKYGISSSNNLSFSEKFLRGYIYRDAPGIGTIL